MSLEVRPITDADKRTVDSWLKAMDWPGLPASLLPDIGFIAEDTLTGAPLAACWLYTTNSPCAFVGWPISNPDIGSSSTQNAQRELMDTASVLAHNLGYRVVLTLAGEQASASRLEQDGFQGVAIAGSPYVKQLA